ncbi:MAG TPA: GNAT family N-acetyltransferase [Patescibacteria group bacterium]|nr:GNAT family N-acetyltransferase [Patescibacteria group bacterium]
MLQIKRFTDFDDAKTQWKKLEQKTFHYPFQSLWYQELFAETFCQKDAVYLLGVYDNETLLATGGFEIVEGIVYFLGMKKVLHGEEVTDFGDILFAKNEQVELIWKTILGYFQQAGFNKIQLDYIREDSQTYAFFANKPGATVTQQEVSPYITLPDTWNAYIATLSRKDRHELKRKIKRLEEQSAFKFCTKDTVDSEFVEFIRLHKLSNANKEIFMSEQMQSFFQKILRAEKNDWETHLCSLTIDKKHVASVFLFKNNEYMLLYNSGYDPEYRNLSVGLLIQAFLIKKAIEQKKKVYDFLRGNERYKYDLGAKDMRLFSITIEQQ